MKNNLAMRWQRFSALFKARNIEFFRDKSTLSWNIIFPAIMIVGFAFVFDGDDKSQFKVGVLETVAAESLDRQETDSASRFLALRYLDVVNYEDEELAIDNIRKHKLDLLISPQRTSYWINESSPKGYVVEQLLLGNTENYQKTVIDGKVIRYLDWVVPGILGMNMMFSCLFGVGYVIVRYRKSSVLKRLKATPLEPIEFILAQIISRLFIVVFMASAVFMATNLLFDFYMLGSWFDLFVVAILGGLCLISLGLLVASRLRSEELTGGVLNLLTWPMMILSGVWFSLEGAPQWLQSFAQILPLTHLVDSARSIMTDGASLWDLKGSLITMAIMTLVFLIASAFLFRWEGDGR